MWSLPTSDFVLHGLSLVAIAAQAMTAALAAGRRSMDWAGVCMLSCITALGGGTIRDVLLGHYPLVWVAQPWLLGLICVAALLTIPIARLVHRLSTAFLVLDAIGFVCSRSATNGRCRNSCSRRRSSSRHGARDFR
jgi:uncharacterized membrane protein YeiH